MYYRQTLITQTETHTNRNTALPLISFTILAIISLHRTHHQTNLGKSLNCILWLYFAIFPFLFSPLTTHTHKPLTLTHTLFHQVCACEMTTVESSVTVPRNSKNSSSSNGKLEIRMHQCTSFLVASPHYWHDPIAFPVLSVRQSPDTNNWHHSGDIERSLCPSKQCKKGTVQKSGVSPEETTVQSRVDESRQTETKQNTHLHYHSFVSYCACYYCESSLVFCCRLRNDYCTHTTN